MIVGTFKGDYSGDSYKYRLSIGGVSQFYPKDFLQYCRASTSEIVIGPCMIKLHLTHYSTYLCATQDVSGGES